MSEISKLEQKLVIKKIDNNTINLSINDNDMLMAIVGQFDQNLKNALLFESCMQEGESALKREKYELAHTLFTEALSYQSGDLKARLNLT